MQAGTPAGMGKGALAPGNVLQSTEGRSGSFDSFGLYFEGDD